MATILTVHGTFASGPDEGAAWWQRGSHCCEEIKSLVEADDGPVKIEPVGWDGLNSELSRQAAAAKLLDRMSELEKAGERYCVVGHSHGGSVISAALVRAVHYKRSLDKLARWITIGTPFIEAKRSRLMFARLGPIGKTVFLSMLAVSVGMGMLGMSMETDGFREPGSLLSMIIIIPFMLLLGSMICYPFLWLMARYRLPWHDRRVQTKAQQSFAARWFSLRHEDDEAVQGLGAFQTVKHPIFARDFAVGFLSRANILLVPLLIILAIYWGGGTLMDRSIRQAQNVLQSAQSSATPLEVEQASPVAKTDAAAQPPAPATGEKTSPIDWGEVIGTLIGYGIVFGIGIGICLGITVAMYHLVRLMARPTSRVLSYGLNRMTWSQIRSSSLGNDMEGENARHARAHPAWLDASYRPLPQTLAAEIAAVSDEAAGKSIAKFRAALSDLGFYRLEQDGKDALCAFLCGEELIHTTYFNIPRFRKLLAYTISQSPGFHPSMALRNDPDFELVKGWYEELEASIAKPEYRSP